MACLLPQLRVVVAYPYCTSYVIWQVGRCHELLYSCTLNSRLVCTVCPCSGVTVGSHSCLPNFARYRTTTYYSTSYTLVRYLEFHQEQRSCGMSWPRVRSVTSVPYVSTDQKNLLMVIVPNNQFGTYFMTF